MTMAKACALAGWIALSLTLSVLPGKAHPLWNASRGHAVRRELREGAREIRRERREAFRAIVRADSPKEFGREIFQGLREIGRERRELRREVRREMGRIRF